jgi:hypothetical protein
VRGGAVLGDGQQVALIRGVADSRDLARLGVAELAAGHGGGNLRQFLERTGYPYFLACGAHGDAALPVEPMRAGLGGAIRPAVAAIELGDQFEEAVIRGIDVAGESADLRREIVDGLHGHVPV